MNWIDTPLLVYANVYGHPARQRAESELQRSSNASTPEVLIECYNVLTRDYAVPAEATAAYLARLAQSQMSWVSLDQSQVASAVREQRSLALQTTDTLLLILAREDGGTLVTTDRRLIRQAQAQGVAVRNPIDPALSVEVARWEEEHLLPKGLGRVLAAVERWLRTEDPRIADRFVAATDHLRRPPA